MTAMEIYELLNKAGIKYEVVEIFEGARFIRIEVEEEEEEEEVDQPLARRARYDTAMWNHIRGLR